MLIGKKLGPLEVDKELGSGAMGSVYRAAHEKSGQHFAVKIIATGLANNESALARFQREVSILKQLNHPNITKYHGAGNYHGAPFYIMEYVEGESLDRVLERRGRLTWEEVIQIGTQLCAALQHSHSRGIIHRDLKPSNLMILEGGTVKLTDFGIAKDTDVTALTAANSTLGTAAYMSPEQCKGVRDLTSKSDLYSMGVVFYELLTGRKPFTAETVMDMFMQHTGGAFERPSRWALDIPVWFDKLIGDLMAKQPEDRPRDAGAVAQALGQIKEKMQAMTSAGMEAAKRKRTQRSSFDMKIEAEDKDVARSLLGKKKKVKSEPFYRKTWFTLSAVACVAALFAGVVYLAFFKAPDAEALYAEAAKRIEGGTLEDFKAAREPISQFLGHYGDHSKAPEVERWRDQAEVEILEHQTKRRYGMQFAPDGAVETSVFEGIDEEQAGKLADAAQRWRDLIKLKSDPEQRPWGLLAERYLGELKAVDELAIKLQAKINQEKTFEKRIEGDTKEESLALEAMRQEEAEDLDKAGALWNELKEHAVRQPELRRWYLMAARKTRDVE
jgi:serine/threonine-protein kinase